MFKIKNLRNNKNYVLENDELRDLIIRETQGKLINGNVKQERTFYRGSAIAEYLTDNFFNKFEGVYLVTANRNINNDADTRHCLICTQDNPELVNFINSNVPILYVHDNQFDFNELDFSKWFRNNMGTGFCITDVDYFLYTDDVAVILEEKNFTPKNNPSASIPWSQKTANQEFMEEVLRRDNINQFYYTFNIRNENTELFVTQDFKSEFNVTKDDIKKFVQCLVLEDFTFCLEKIQELDEEESLQL